MKKNIVLRIITGFMVLSLLSNCREEPGKKYIEDSQESQKEIDKNLSEIVDQKDKDMMTTVKRDWEKFKNESESVILHTENQIKHLREKISKLDKMEREQLHKTLDSLEHKNKKLKERLAQRALEVKEEFMTFNTEIKEKEQKFEKEFKDDINEIKKAFEKIFKPDDSILDQ